MALGVGRSALPAVLAACLGSDLWTVGSQAPWQHGPAALSLIAAIALLHRRPPGPVRLALAGVFTALLVACRLMDIVFALAILAWLAWTNRRGLLWFLPAPILAGTALLAYNIWFFDTILGGQARLERFHQKLHGVSGSWSGNLVDGLLGTLLQPKSRTARLQPVDRRGARHPVHTYRATTALRSLTDLCFNSILDSLSAYPFQIFRLVGWALLWSAVLDRRYSPLRDRLCPRI